MHKITRIAYNSADWQRPTGDASKSESSDTYNGEHGFGHEDWLFRDEWQIDGWRYAFIQGVNKSRKKMVRFAAPFDLTLYTIQPDKRRRLVAKIEAVEALDDVQANEALDAFKQNGWYDQMCREIEAVKGNVSALGNHEWADSILNVRFRVANVHRYAENEFVSEDDPVNRRNRYQLTDAEELENPTSAASSEATPDAELPSQTPHERRAIPPVVVTPEHARIQARLIEELRNEYPSATVSHEENYVDVSLRTETEITLFEIKSDLDPKTVIREALGQILEYAYHPSRTYDLPLRLVVVGRVPLGEGETGYLNILRTRFQIPLEYREVRI